jgi:hypothetical protein
VVQGNSSKADGAEPWQRPPLKCGHCIGCRAIHAANRDHKVSKIRVSGSRVDSRKCAEHAAEVGRVVVPEETSVFTVKLPSTLAARARESGATISALVAQALTEYLAGGERNRPRR